MLTNATRAFILGTARKATVAGASAGLAALIPAVCAVTQDGMVTVPECVVALGGVLTAALTAARLTFSATNTPIED